MYLGIAVAVTSVYIVIIPAVIEAVVLLSVQLYKTAD